jgi:putative hydrolase of the HAD superfamily
MIKAVFFDLGGTLVQTAEVPEIFMRILKVFGIEVSYEEVFDAHEANKAELDVAAGQIRCGMEFGTEFNSRFLRRLGVGGDVETLARNISRLWWDNADVRFYPDVLEVLSWLKARNVKVGVVTNALREDYEQILERLGATCLFDVVVGIDDCRRAKPDRQIFLYALDRLGVKPDEALFVGNELETDYNGATGAGLKALFIDRDGKSKDEANRLTTLKELRLHIP